MFRLTLLNAIIFPSLVMAFPDNVRHGYFSCTACHVSPSGGGVLTPYGKSLSAELMSTWGSTKTAGMFFSDTEDQGKNPQWLRLNLFSRGAQTYRNSKLAETAKFIPMQEDLEAGIDIEKLVVVASIGLRSKEASSTTLNEVFSRRHYLIYRISDAFNVRVGKFIFAFGLNGPDHITATRRGLGWNQGMESYNMELSFLGEQSATILTALSSSPEERNLAKDSGGALTQNFLIGEHSKLGLNVYYGTQSVSNRFVYGPSWVFSLTERLFLNSEFFVQSKTTKDSGVLQTGYATFHRLNYQLAKGLTPFVQVDRSFLDDSSPTTRVDSYGGGLQWLPISHFETVAFLGKEKAFNQDPTDFGWVMFNLYL